MKHLDYVKRDSRERERERAVEGKLNQTDEIIARCI